MADLVTHLASVLLPAAFLPRRRRRWAGLLATGVILPDVSTHLPSVGLDLARSWTNIPEWTTYPFAVCHMPAGMVLVAALTAHVFVPEQQRRAFGWLLVGAAAHLLVDSFQDHHGLGYYLFAPVSLSRWELGWMGSEATVPWALPLAVGTALAWGVTEWIDRRRQPSVDPGANER